MGHLSRRSFLWCATGGMLGWRAAASLADSPALPLFVPHAAVPRVLRFARNPIIRPEMLPGGDGRNINGPSLIRVPGWIRNPLGKYYLYFADHGGQYIRLAYANRLVGPWKVYAPGTLHLEQAPNGTKHIASPDVHVCHDAHELRMYFHCPSKTLDAQTTYLARSTDGLHFVANSEPLGPSYFRVFPFGGYWYAMAKPGQLFRSQDGTTAFERGHNPFDGLPKCGQEENGPRMRHVALEVAENTLYVYFTNIGDKPERILRSSIVLTPNWIDWKASPPELVLKPETAYEGADLPLAASSGGKAKARENAVRDPAIFKHRGRTYLLYSVAGESGIAMAELVPAASHVRERI